MRILFIISFCFLSFTCSCQGLRNIFFDVSNMISKKNTRSYYNISNLTIGKSIIYNKSSIDFGFSYGFSGNLSGVTASTYIFKSHLFGGRVDYSFWLNNENSVKPYISLALYTEIASNYYNGTLFEDMHKPIPIRSFTQHTPSYKARFYQGTPIVANFFVGFSVKLTKSFFFKTAFGFGYENIKTKYVEWQDEEYVIIENKLKDKVVESHPLFSYNLQIGLRYTFPLKKSSTSQ